MSMITPPPPVLAFWVSVSDVAGETLRADGYEVHANILADACGLLMDKWSKEYGESFDENLEQLLSSVYQKDGQEGNNQ